MAITGAYTSHGTLQHNTAVADISTVHVDFLKNYAMISIVIYHDKEAFQNSQVNPVDTLVLEFRDPMFGQLLHQPGLPGTSFYQGLNNLLLLDPRFQGWAPLP